MIRTILEHPTPGTTATAPGAVTLRHAPEASPHHPYQTHWRNDQDGGHYYGHYFKTLEEAREDYEARCKRGY